MKEFINQFKTAIKTAIRMFLKLSLAKKIIFFAILGILLWFGIPRLVTSGNNQPRYQTALAEIGTLVSSVTVSGTVASTNNVSVTTQASGIVENIYVKDGDFIEIGKPIAKLKLDQSSQQKQVSAWSSYLSAQNSLNTARAKMNSLQSALFKANQTFINDKGISNPNDAQKADPKYIQENADWLQAEADYKNQSGVISQTQSSLSSAWLSYQQTSDTITAPISGTVSDLTLNVGGVITSTGETSGSTGTNGTNASSSNKVATIKTEGKPSINVNLTEIDVSKVKVGNKATITLDAFAGKTFTGKVISIDTAGSVSSGVTTYPTRIEIDTDFQNFYPNMSATASIITNTKDNILLVPMSSVQIQGDQSNVRVLRNGVVQTLEVETGESSDTEIEIVSGLKEGDEVITGTLGNSASFNQQRTNASPFGTFRTGSFGGSGGMRMQR